MHTIGNAEKIDTKPDPMGQVEQGIARIHEEVGHELLEQYTRDGLIDEDALGLNKVYIQAKRYASSNSVQRTEVQSFAGALRGKADGGVFIATGRFTSDARDYVKTSPDRIIRR